MSAMGSAHDPDTLLAGPRGRRLVLEYALASELAHHPDRSELTFGYAAMRAAHDNDSERHVTASARTELSSALQNGSHILTSRNRRRACCAEHWRPLRVTPAIGSPPTT